MYVIWDEKRSEETKLVDIHWWALCKVNEQDLSSQINIIILVK